MLTKIKHIASTKMFDRSLFSRHLFELDCLDFLSISSAQSRKRSFADAPRVVAALGPDPRPAALRQRPPSILIINSVTITVMISSSSSSITITIMISSTFHTGFADLFAAVSGRSPEQDEENHETPAPPQ